MKKFLLSIGLLFVLLSVVFYILKVNQPQYSFNALMGGNIIMLFLSVATWLIVKKQVAARPEAFVRGVYAATFMKLLVCIGAILIYVLINKETLHKPSLFILFGIYMLYSIVESAQLSKMAREKKK